VTTYTAPDSVRGAGPATGGDPGRTLMRRGRLAGPIALAMLLVAQIAVPQAVLTAAPLLAVVGILIGVPHGAVDHVVPFWLAGRPVTRGQLAAVVAVYLAIAAAATAAFLLAPGPTLLAFLLLSAVHFGRGEVVSVAESRGTAVPGARQDVLPTLAHGAVVVGLPVALWPGTSLPLLETLAPSVAQLPAALPIALGAVAAALVVAALAALVLAGRRSEAAELVLLVVVFTVVPPLAAFGVYFGLWHALRHTTRLVTLPGPAGPLPVRAGWARYARHAALPTAVALGALVGLWATRTPSLLTAELAVLLALTFPHARVVAALDGARSGSP